MRVVFDTNAIISALLFRGTASWLIEHWQSGKVTLLVSRETAHELLRVLAYPKFGLSPAQAEAVATRYLRHAERVECAGYRNRETLKRLLYQYVICGEFIVAVIRNENLAQWHKVTDLQKRFADSRLRQR